ncbi:peptidoglycan-binding domain-containing protein [Microbacterium sp. DT81.1]|uniref:peptidoglycan-binding domain-containing protein n=1 Tax=Microbacterium sp. DT81.1 TaxID=3393413 RepID=UPI003CEC775C
MGQTRGGGIAGVLGQGRFSQFGVMGTGFEGSTGVVGVSVANTSDLFNHNVPPGDFRLESLGDGRGTGVLGRSATGFGVRGISESNTAVVGFSTSGFGAHGDSKTNTGVVGSSERGFGVHGISRSDNTGVVGSSEGSGIGVHGLAATNSGVRGSSTSGNGGVFESELAAPIRLIPKALATPEGTVRGNGGELLVTTSHDESGQNFALWFCARAGDAASTVWALVAGVRPYPGTVSAEGMQGTTVKHIQRQLNIVAASGLVADGDFGPITKQAVADFQTFQGLDVDGVVDSETWDRLFETN